MELALQYNKDLSIIITGQVTILVFMELALQFAKRTEVKEDDIGHNPCFYGISFAIWGVRFFGCPGGGHNPCFYGISFAIRKINKTWILFNLVTILVFMELALQLY